MVVMFVDLVDSTKRSASISPELPNVIKGFSQVTFLIEYYAGHVLKFGGDAIFYLSIKIIVTVDKNKTLPL